MAKIGGTGVIDTMTKMDGANCGKNDWSSQWQKWLELTVAKMGRALHDKNGWNSLWQKWVELVI